MKGFLAVGASLCIIVGASASASVHVPVHKSKEVSFGPQGCVRLTRSSAGSCVLSTECEGIDISQTEFAFNCVGEHVVRHSFGVGGFDVAEDFDTEVKCRRCQAPTPAEPPAKPKHMEVFALRVTKPTAKIHEKLSAKAELKHEVQPVNLKSHETVKKVTLKRVNPTRPFDGKPKAAHLNAKDELKVVPAVNLNAKAAHLASAKIWPFTSTEKKEKESNTSLDVVKYGPNKCVSVYRNKEGHCVMATDCKQADIASYSFGLLCVDKAGSSVKHQFGEDSFDPVENFDTLIKCDQCLGLENVPGPTALAGEVAAMHKDLSDIEKVVVNISLNVQKLNDEVFKSKSAAPSPAAAAPAAPAAVVLVHHAASVHHSQKVHLRHSQKRHAEEQVAKEAKAAVQATKQAAEEEDTDNEMRSDAEQEAAKVAQGSSDSSYDGDEESRDTDGSENQDESSDESDY